MIGSLEYDEKAASIDFIWSGISVMNLSQQMEGGVESTMSIS